PLLEGGFEEPPPAAGETARQVLRMKQGDKVRLGQAQIRGGLAEREYLGPRAVYPRGRGWRRGGRHRFRFSSWHGSCVLRLRPAAAARFPQGQPGLLGFHWAFYQVLAPKGGSGTFV